MIYKDFTTPMCLAILKMVNLTKCVECCVVLARLLTNKLKRQSVAGFLIVFKLQLPLALSS